MSGHRHIEDSLSFDNFPVSRLRDIILTQTRLFAWGPWVFLGVLPFSAYHFGMLTRLTACLADLSRKHELLRLCARIGYNPPRG